MNRKLFTLTLITIFVTTILKAQSCENLSQKEAFTIGFPQFYMFRGEMNKKTHNNYETWKTEIQNSNGIIRKFINEELLLNANSASWANSYAKDNPSKLMQLHLNGEARHVIRNPEILKKYFPGHWVYEEGSILKRNITNKDDVIQVENMAPFINRKYRGGNGEGKDFKREDIPNYILLVRVDENGNRLWYDSEVAQIIKIDKDSKNLTISRGLCNTKQLDFNAKKTYVAPISGGVWGGGVMFFYNLSIDCPKDKNEMTATDVFVNEIAEWFSTKGILKNFNGIAFDVNYFDISDRFPLADTNNDGKRDGGWINNLNNWRAGDYLFLKKLRTKMGNNFVITADGHHAENQQAVGILNGFESEGLVQHNDGWRGFSRTVNTHQYWEHNNTATPEFRYVVLKLMNNEDAINKTRLKRFAIGTACCLKAMVTDPNKSSEDVNVASGRSEILPDWMTISGALGQAKGMLIHFAKQTADVLNKSMIEIEKLISTEDCNLKVTNNELEITSNRTSDNTRDLNLSLNNLSLPSGDITVFIEAQAIDPLEGMKPTDRVPRTMWVSIKGLSDYSERSPINYFNNLTGLFGTTKPVEMSFYFRRPKMDSANTKTDISIKIQGKGKVIIKSIKIYNQADILIRKFDNGLVIVNPSFETKIINPTDFGIISKSVEVPPVDAYFVKK